MQLTHGKISNYIGQAKKDEKLNEYFISVDKDLQNLWRITNAVSPLVGTFINSLTNTAIIGFTFVPVMTTHPTATPTNFQGKAAMVYCLSNSNFYIYNSSMTNWTTVNLV